ncbi:MAG: peptidylprolyl isomerase [Isosphaeraceae bacterium]|jgi:peptidyl-prolyl cis-trans isomerase C|nr:MAG: peptidylprolyl isomerase [Isosphaeraceae bacterium]
MRERVHRAAVTLLAACAIPGLGAVSPQQPATAQPPAAATSSKPARDEPVAVVNGRPIPLADLIDVLAKIQIPPGSEQQAFESALDYLVNRALLRQFLDETARVTVSADELKKIEDEARAEANRQGTSLESFLADTGTTIEEFRDQIAFERKWRNYVTQQATDSELKAYAEQNKDLFSGAQVRASHILIKLEPNASPEEKEKARQRLLAIRQEIADQKISFADAANKYSEDEGNREQPSGGDLGKFPRRGIYIEPFAQAAFALQKGQLSDIVETEYGLHLILVTDREEGQPIDFERMRNVILNQYAADLQNQIIEQMRKTAQIDLKPMPKDLFQLIPRDESQPAAPAPAAGSATPAGSAPPAQPSR